MTRLRFFGSVSMTLVLALSIIQPAIAQPVSPLPYPSSTSDSTDRSYKIYSLDDFGSDPGLCKWIAQTIPQVIAAGTWGNREAISYYAPKNLLAVCHTSAVQAQVDNFLKDVKKSLSDTTKARASAPKSYASGREDVPTVYYKPELRTVGERLREAFPGGEVETSPVRLCFQSKRLLIAADKLILETDGKVKLMGCAIARFQAPKESAEASPPTTIRCKFARIEFDRPAHSTNELLHRKIVSVELSDGVRLSFQEEKKADKSKEEEKHAP